ncbi:MAG: myosin kinase [Oscillatoriales cyanobacterium CG2_30_44_21]|nr:MAG: myosin kinase [Oscillatoriales cyanobacterium CG2_30_44_21]
MVIKLIQQPQPRDAVLGGKIPPPTFGAVLGGLEGVKQRLNSREVIPQIAALREALNYGEAGLELVIASLTSNNITVQRTAMLLLWRRPESYVQKILAEYSAYYLFDIADTLQSHRDAITSLAISPNGKTLYSAGADFKIKVWNLGKDNRANCLGTIHGHTHIVTAIALSANGKLLVSGSRDKTVKVWDARSGKQLLTLTGHIGYVNSVALTPDGKTLVTGSQDTTIKLWDIRTGRELHTLRGHTSLVDSVALSPDGKLIASCSWDTTIRVWDITGQLRWEFIGHSARVLSFAISPDSRILVSGSLDTRIKVWDLQTGKSIRTLEGHWGWVKSLLISGDGKTLISASYKEIRVWNLETGKQIQVLNGHINLINAIALSPDGQTLVSGGEDRHIHVWGVPYPKNI